MDRTRDLTRRLILTAAPATAALGALAGCGTTGTAGSQGSPAATASTTAAATGPSTTDPGLVLDGAAWSYDSEGDVYYQLGVSYAATPQAPDYETLGVFVPGAYMTATGNGDGTYTAAVNTAGAVGSFTAETAPAVLPVDTPGYSAQKPPTEYSYATIEAYMKAGLIYVQAGLRGKDSTSETYSGNAPWGVTDLKAAVRYLRYNAALIPGDSEKVYIFGHSGGGAQTAVAGASGDSGLYAPYLAALGAATTDPQGAALSDAVAGAMCWCPITSLDSANGAYEWNMGQFATTATRAEGTWTQRYSRDLATAYAEYINALRLTDAEGAVLALEASQEGIYLSGSYYDHLVAVIQDSLNEFLAATAFPYTPSSTQMAGMGGGQSPAGQPEQGEATTYETVQDYIAALNADSSWVAYDAATNTATISDLAGFVASQKSATKDVGAFDGVDRGQTENIVMGSGASGLHFSSMSRQVMAAHQSDYSSLEGWSQDYAASGYEEDLATTDSQGTDMITRVSMYDPMHYLTQGSPGRQTSTIAPSWRIRTGIAQNDTASTVEVNLALALAQAGVAEVDFATVWGQGHTMAELSGSGEDNFISWVVQQAAP